MGIPSGQGHGEGKSGRWEMSRRAVIQEVMRDGRLTMLNQEWYVRLSGTRIVHKRRDPARTRHARNRLQRWTITRSGVVLIKEGLSTL